MVCTHTLQHDHRAKCRILNLRFLIDCLKRHFILKGKKNQVRQQNSKIKIINKPFLQHLKDKRPACSQQKLKKKRNIKSASFFEP